MRSIGLFKAIPKQKIEKIKKTIKNTKIPAMIVFKEMDLELCYQNHWKVLKKPPFKIFLQKVPLTWSIQKGRQWQKTQIT